jgi:hypothetical protein
VIPRLESQEGLYIIVITMYNFYLFFFFYFIIIIIIIIIIIFILDMDLFSLLIRKRRNGLWLIAEMGD